MQPRHEKRDKREGETALDWVPVPELPKNCAITRKGLDNQEPLSKYPVILGKRLRRSNCFRSVQCNAYGLTEDWGKKFYKNQVQRLVARNGLFSILSVATKSNSSS